MIEHVLSMIKNKVWNFTVQHIYYAASQIPSLDDEKILEDHLPFPDYDDFWIGKTHLKKDPYHLITKNLIQKKWWSMYTGFTKLQ